MRSLLKYSWFTLFSLMCLGVTYYAFTYLMGPINPNNSFKMKLVQSGWVAPMHFYAAGLALALVPLQLSQKLRRKATSMHRIVGGIYVVAVLLGGISGLLMALNATGGWVAKSGFFSLAVLWLWTTALALNYAIKGDIKNHQKWIYRSIALTAAGITLRLFLGIGLGVLQLPFLTVYVPTAWLCWTLNLAICEFIIHRRQQPSGAYALT